MIRNEQERTKILPIASGKGGVGKSLITANLGILLATNGRKTVVIDLDLGGSNLHSYLDMKNENPGIGNWLAYSEQPSFQSLICPTPYPNLGFVPGDALVAGAPTITMAQRKQLMARIGEIKSDYILLDVGPGSNSTTIDFFLMSDSAILVTLPTVPSILNCYNFLKNALFRRLMLLCADHHKAKLTLEQGRREKKPGNGPRMIDIVKTIAATDPKLGAVLQEEISALHPHLILNMTQGAKDMGICANLRSLTEKTLGIKLECLGVMFEDPTIRQSTPTNQPPVLTAEDYRAMRQLDRIAQKLLLSPDYPNMPLDFDTYGDSFGLAEIEVASDALEEDGGDQAAGSHQHRQIIAAQQKTIEELESTVRILSAAQQR